MNNNEITVQLKITLWFFLGLMSLLGIKNASADPWVYCADEGETCSIPGNVVEGTTVRFGNQEKIVYKYGVATTDLLCSSAIFGDPAEIRDKKCYYSTAPDLDPSVLAPASDFNDSSIVEPPLAILKPSSKFAENRPANETISALHSVFPEDVDGALYLRHSEFLASTLSEGEKLITEPDEDGSYMELQLQFDGNLVLAHRAAGGTRRVTWQSGTADPEFGTVDNLFSLYVAPYGVELRKNGTPIWDIYPFAQGGSAGIPDLKLNYVLHINDAEELVLDNMDLGFREWSSASGYTSLELSHENHKKNWLKMGWGHIEEWGETEVNTFVENVPSLSHFDVHTFLNATVAFGEYEASEALDAIGTLVEEVEDAASKIGKALKNAVETAELDWAIIKNLPKIVESIFNGDLAIIQHYEPLVEDMIRFGDTDHARTLISLLEGIDDRRLSAVADVNESKAPCGPLCAKLSRDHNQKLRIDWALESATTFQTYVQEAWGGGESGWLDQITFRLFFTHPRIKEGRITQDFRIRLLDYSGGKYEEKILNDFLVTAGFFRANDIVISYSWAPNDETVSNARFDGVKYSNFTGVLLEADADFSKLVTQIINIATYAVNRVGRVVGPYLPDLPGFLTTGIANLTARATPLVNLFRRIENATGLKQFDGEVVVGGGMYNVFNLTEMSKYKKDPESEEESNALSPGELFGTILVTEIFGTAGFVTLSAYTGVLEAGTEAAAESTVISPTAVLNADYIASAVLSDLIYSVAWRLAHPNADAINIGVSTFATVAVKASPPWIIEGKRTSSLTGVLGAGITPIRARFQANWELDTKEFVKATPAITSIGEYGVYKFETEDGLCIEEGAKTCDEDSDRQLWLMNKTSDGAFEVRNKLDGKCLGHIGDIIIDGTIPTLLPCKDHGDPNTNATRWNILADEDNKIVFQSLLDTDYCLDTGDFFTDGNVMRECESEKSSQQFTPKAEAYMPISPNGNHVIQTNDGSCIDNESNIFNHKTDARAKQQHCNNNDHQRWVFLPATDKGNFDIQMKGSDKCLILKNTFIQLGECSTEDSLWTPELTGDANNFMKIKFAFTENCMEVLTGGKTTAGYIALEQCDDENENQNFQVIFENFHIDGGLDTGSGRGLEASGENYIKLDFDTTNLVPPNADQDAFGKQFVTDGLREGITNLGKTQTDITYDNESYWEGDLGGNTLLHSVTVFNQIGPDNGVNTLAGFYLLISDTEFTSGSSLADSRANATYEIYKEIGVSNQAGKNMYNFYFPADTKGQFVRIQKEFANEQLILAEVEVYGNGVDDREGPKLDQPAKISFTGDNVVNAAYLNGVALDVVNGGEWEIADVLDVNLGSKGSNVMAFEVSDGGGNAGFIAELVISGDKTVTDASCRVTTTDPGANWSDMDFDDSTWRLATNYGAYGVTPWNKSVNGFSDDMQANWIWSSNAEGDNKIFVRCGDSVNELTFVTATQSSTEDDNDNFGPLKAIDGNTFSIASRELDNSVSLTGRATAGWWQGDLGSSKTITEVTVYNRTDFAQGRLYGAYILITDVPTEGKTLGQARASANAEVTIGSPPASTSPTFRFPAGTTGKYVVIYSPTFPINLAEVTGITSSADVDVDVDVDGRLTFVTASQKDTYRNNDSVSGALKAIDRNYEGLWSDLDTNSVTHTNTKNAWWQGDLGSSKAVESVTIFNRTDCCADRLRNFFILITDVPTEGKTLTEARASANSVESITWTWTPDMPQHTFTLPMGSNGRYVVIWNPADLVHIAEVEANGSADTSINFTLDRLLIDFEGNGQIPGSRPRNFIFDGDSANVAVVNATASGDYSGGKAIRTGESGATFAGHRLPFTPANNSAIVTLSADFLWDFQDMPTLTMSGWDDVNNDGTFQQNETTIGFGLGNDGQFELNSEVGRIPGSTNFEANTWYRLTMEWGDVGPAGNRTVSISALDLTNSNDLGVVTSAIMSASEFGVDPSEWEGIAIRMTRGTIDNIDTLALRPLR